MKIIIAICLTILLLFGAGFFSYTKSKEQAKKVAQSFAGPLSPMKTQFILYIDHELTPCWVFRAEYEDVITGATFDVYVSLLGKVIEIPPKSKMPE